MLARRRRVVSACSQRWRSRVRSRTSLTDGHTSETHGPLLFGRLVIVDLLVDTCVLIDHLAGVPTATQVLARALSGDRVCVSAISVLELFQKAGLTPDEQARRRDLLAALELLPLSGDVAIRAGTRATDVRNITPDTILFDAAIAETAAELGMTVVTRNTNDYAILGTATQSY